MRLYLRPTRVCSQSVHICMVDGQGRNRLEAQCGHVSLGRAGADRQRILMKTRRLFSALERPVGTSSGHNRVWHGYAPYNPRMLEKYLAIFRATHNFVFVGDDGKTPAMRLGFARQPLAFARHIPSRLAILTAMIPPLLDCGNQIPPRNSGQ